ncbi:MAG: YceI family protein [Bdellovibrionota bacterium]
MKTKLLMSVLAAGLFAVQTASAATYEIDPSHTSAQFSVRHMMLSNVKGEFTKVKGTVSYDPANVAASSVEATIDTSSVNTREPKRDDHLKSPEFFDAQKFPSMTFKSTKVEKGPDGKLAVTGNLTIHGITKEVVLDVDGPTDEVKDPWGNFRRGASATVKLNRQDFGLKWNKLLETGGVVVGDDVAITIDVEMTRK